MLTWIALTRRASNRTSRRRRRPHRPVSRPAARHHRPATASRSAPRPGAQHHARRGRIGHPRREHRGPRLDPRRLGRRVRAHRWIGHDRPPSRHDDRPRAERLPTGRRRCRRLREVRPRAAADLHPRGGDVRPHTRRGGRVAGDRPTLRSGLRAGGLRRLHGGDGGATLDRVDALDIQRLLAVVEAEQERTARQIASLEAIVAAIVEGSELTSTDDEHDPEGATIAYERAQASALLRQARADRDALVITRRQLDECRQVVCSVCGRAIDVERVAALPTTEAPVRGLTGVRVPRPDRAMSPGYGCAGWVSRSRRVTPSAGGLVEGQVELEHVDAGVAEHGERDGPTCGRRWPA